MKAFRWWRAVAVAVLVLPVVVATPSAAHPGGSGDTVRILRDEYGVPHVYASTVRGLFHGVGYAQGQDRLWQAEIHRRLATGTLSDLFGPSVLPGDVVARQMFGSQARRAALLRGASPTTRAVLESFTGGMNAWIADATRTGALPTPYGLVGPPRPWTVDDSVATYLYFAHAFGTFGGEELDNLAELQDLVARLGEDEGRRVFADAHWLDDPSAPTTVPGRRHDPHASAADSADSAAAADSVAAAGGATEVSAAAAPLPDARVLEAARITRESLAAAERVYEQYGVKRGPASNAVVIGPRLTTDRRALLLGGPQMGYGTPQVNHEIGIHGAGFDVTGMELAGWPLLPIGVTPTHAWTLTSGGTDNTDLYVETIRLLPGATVPEHLFRGRWTPMDCRTEAFVTGPRQLCETGHGPVLSPLPTAPTDGTTAIAVRIAPRGQEMHSYDAWMELGRARDLGEFAAAASEAAYNFNLFYADRRGNIAYWHIGRFPRRAAGDNPFLPHDGSGGAEWQGFMPFSHQPRSVNPDRGWLASWNNKPEPGWDNSSAGFWQWGPVHRVNTLANQLDRIRPGTATPATLERLNRIGGTTTDTPSGAADTVVVPTLLDALLGQVDTGADPRLASVVQQLRSWDELQVDANGDDRYDDPSVAIFNTWWPALTSSVFDELPAGEPNVVGNLVSRLIGAVPGSLPLAADYLDGRPVRSAVTAALVTALDELTALYGADQRGWLHPAAHIVWEPLPLTPAVPDTIWMNRGTYNQLVHIGHGRLAARNFIAPGQSGDPASPHFADQLDLYTQWRYKPMRLDRSDLVGHVTSTVTLRVPR
jgi:penicillin G amidase